MKLENKMQPCFIQPERSRLRYKSYQDFLANFVEKDQLLNEHLWERFVAQFIDQPDGDGAWRGEYFGKMLRGGCLTYQYTRSSALYRMLEIAVMRMVAVQDKDGRISSYPRGKEYFGWDMWCRKYVMLGMEYFLEICKNEKRATRILRCIEKQAQFIMKDVGEGEDQISITKTSHWWGGLNSCSILEPFVRLYRLTGKDCYREFAEYIISTGFCADGNLIEMVNDGIEPWKYPQVKAYEMMSCFEGLAEYAILMGRQDLLDTAVKFAKLVKQSDVTIIGCCGCTHELFDHSVVRQTEYSGENIMQETCVTVTWMKLCYRLLQMTGESCFADWIEQSALNALSGAVNDFENQKNCALTFDSYSPLVRNSRGRKTGGKQMISENEYYGCCACIGSAGTAIANLYGFLTAQDGIVINVYQPGKAEFTTPAGRKGVVHISSRVPESGCVRVKITLPAPEEFAVYLRIPEWSRKTAVKIGEEPQPLPKSGSYMILKRAWQKQDVISIILDVTARVQSLNGMAAIVKGGYVLARDARHGSDYGDAVALSWGKSGRVNVRSIEPTIRAQMQYLLRMDDGKEIAFIDYASAGKNWDDPDSGANVWMPLKELPTEQA